MNDYLSLMLVTGFFGVWFGTWITRGASRRGCQDITYSFLAAYWAQLPCPARRCFQRISPVAGHPFRQIAILTLFFKVI